MQKLTALLVSFFYCSISFAQVNTDSLLAVLPKAANDTNKVNIYKDLTGTLRFSDPQKAIILAQEGLKLAEQLKFKRGITWLHFNISTAYANSGKLDTSLLYLNKALPGYIELKELSRIGLTYLNRADVYRQLQDHAQTLKDCDSALYYAEKANNNDIKARVYQTFAALYFHQDNHEQSISYYNKAYSLYSDQKNIRMCANVLNNLGLVYRAQKNFKMAATVTENAIKLADSLQNEIDLSIFNSNMADIYFGTDDFNRSEIYADKAMYYAERQQNDWLIAVAAIHKGNASLKQGKYDEALPYLKKALQSFTEMNDPERINNAAELLAELYAKKGNYAMAYENILVSRAASDTLHKLRFAEEIAAMQAKFKVDEKDNEIQLLAKDKELQRQKLNQQRILITGAIILVSLILLGAWLLLNRYRLKQKMKELELRNSIAADLHDEVGSSLSSIHMLSQMASSGKNPEQQLTILQKMSSNAKETMEKMGDIVWMIKPGETEAGSLRQKIERFATEVCESKGIELSLSLQDMENAELDMDQRKNIYLICKEAINNAAKYAEATVIEITTEGSNNWLKITVKDNGKGFDTLIEKSGNGLKNMKSRAKEISAVIKIESGLNKGTGIELTLDV